MTGGAIPAAEWTEFLDGEYLSEYIPQGGSAVKFAVCEAEAADRLAKSLLAAGARRNYAAVMLRAEDFRAHMPQDVYCQIAAQLDWRGLVRERILRLAADASLTTEGIATAGNEDLFGSLTKKNRITRQEVVQEVQKQISAQVYRRRSMTRNFRVAMTELCRAENATGGAPYTADPVFDWLTGREKRASVVRPFFIYGTIDRTTARGMFESTLHWLRDCGLAGLIVLLDNRRVLTTPNPKDGLKYYTRMMVLDHYEVLRELIDDIDRLPGLLLVVTTDAAFVQAGRRSYREYQALAMRIMNDVRDERRQNRAAALVTVS
ncbi:MAG: DUF2791 family P-loop domain-containing protein [Gammaproteobacteria bacterium]|nr:DUF2791 family P-loop domain-containing protein [Gammaproteobacteria bacterium]